MTKWTARPWLKATVVCSAGALMLTGCLEESGGGGSEGGGGGGGGDGTVEIMYGFSGDQSEAFQDVVGAWAEEEGIDVQFSSTPDFDKLVRSRVQGQNEPDIAIFPQPGIMLDIAETGALNDLGETLDQATIEDLALIDAGTSPDGTVYAAPMSISVKSLVWYPKQAFEAAGYQIPETQDELMALTEQIKADGTTPWCVGIEAQAATGWPATDWMEDYVLRVGGGDFYDQWVRHEVPFNDPTVVEAGKMIEDIWFAEGNVLGGRNAITSTAFSTAGNPMFDEPPGCMLHRQASFLAQPGSFPDAVVENLDEVAGVFPLPPIEAGEQPIMGAGDLAAIFTEADEDAVAVLEYLTSTEYGEAQAPSGGFISPRKSIDVSVYPNETMRQIAEIGYSATVFKFDGSDQMPGEVGAGSFWRGSVEWVGGAELETVLQQIEDSWPTS
jgi:alpha-glucoside transport system substrate-binding protein